MDQENKKAAPTILVVFTGGTIGSRASGSLIDLDGQAGYDLLARYAAMTAAAEREHGGGGMEGRGAAEASERVRFETVQPYRILSENMNPTHWEALIACIRQAGPERYSGVIVTHGSDTLAFTAAALSYAFAEVGVPIVLVAANYPLDDARSNGLRNFAASVDFIAGSGLAGVYAVFENGRGELPVYLGTRLIEAVPFSDQFGAPYDAPLGCMREGRFEPLAHDVNPPLDELRPGAARSAGKAGAEADHDERELRFSTDVLYIRPYPGLDYGWYDWPAGGAAVPSRKPSAVLHGLYHSATANGEEAAGMREASFTAFAKRCAGQGVDLYVAPAKDADAARYNSAEVGLGEGALALRKVTVEAALVKLMAAYGTYPHDPEARSAYLARNVFFEHHSGGQW
jgi:L-asparaginase